VTASSSAFPARSEPREVVELRRLRERQPQLASAIDLQLELLDLHRRMAGRVSLPRNYSQITLLADRLAQGEPLLRFEEITLDWSDVRRLLRDTADLLRRFGMMDTDDCQRVHALTREGHTMDPLVRWWYESAAAPAKAGPAPVERAEYFDHALLLAMRPFLARAAEALLSRVDCSAWTRANCPLCGGDPELAVWPADSGHRHLLCSRCAGQWRFPEDTCPFCDDTDPAHRRSFVSPSRAYRVDACNGCQRYLKGFDGRAANRVLMLSFDTIATLPLDAAAIQQGYLG
jgi:FdhE protein